MDTQHLKAFVAITKNGSFSNAANELHLTQSAISKRIAMLESQLECQLFDRIGRNVALTEAGRALLPRAEKILQSVRDTQQLIHDLSGQVSGKLHIATSHHIGLHHLPQVLRQFTADFPEVKLDIDFMDSEKAHDAVLKGEIELGIVTLAPVELPGFKDDKQHIEATAIWEDPLSVVLSPEHPLLKKTKKPTLEQLAKLPAILPDLNTYTGQLVQRHFATKGLNLNLSMATNYLETIKMMVSIGLGWSVLPETMVDKQLIKIDVGDLKLMRHLGYIQHSDRSLSNAARAFIAACRNTTRIN